MVRDEPSRDADTTGSELESVAAVEAPPPPDAEHSDDAGQRGAAEQPALYAFDVDEADLHAPESDSPELPEVAGGGDFSLTKESVTTPEPRPVDNGLAPLPRAEAPPAPRLEPAPLPEAPALPAAPRVDAAPVEDPFLVDPWPDGERTQTLKRRRLSRVDAFAEYQEHLSFLDAATPPPQVLDPQLRPRPEAAPEQAPSAPEDSLFPVTNATGPAQAGDDEDDDELEEHGTHVWEFQGSEAPAPDEHVDRSIVAGRYRMEEELAVGGMARIYRVTHLNLEREFAMKILSAEMSARPVIRKNFVREAKVASQMEHPNIVGVTDFGVDDAYGAFIVMEYLKGETLRNRLHRKGPMRLPVALDVGLQLAEALHYIHERNIIHCDIKAENIFLVDQPKEQRRRTVAKLLDFGLSKTKAMGAQLARSEVGGTPHYMSPEHFAGIAPQPSMDIYSLGVLLYEMVAGRPPFDGDLERLAVAHLKERPRPPSSRLAEPLDERVDELILKALEKKPEDRQATMGQLVYELRTLMDMLGYKEKRRVAKAEARALQPEVHEGALVFENCPCPQFRVDQQLNIVIGNAAFCSFLGQEAEELLGKPLDDTKFRHVYPNLRTDFFECLLAKTDLQHRIVIKKKNKADAHLLLWLVQEVDQSTDAVSFSGIIVPQGV
jgi:PAS domain-containing protein